MKHFHLLAAALVALMITACDEPNKPETPPTPEPLPTSFPKKNLLEHFTSEVCPNCPGGVEQIDEYMAVHPNTIWLSHHAGYKADQWTIVESKNVVSLLGISGAPEVSLNRTKLTYTDEDTKKPVTALSYHPYYINKLTSVLPETTYASVTIAPVYDAATRELKIRVSGLVLDSAVNEVYVHMAIKENGCHGKQEDPDNTFAGWADYVHNNVIRAVVPNLSGTRVAVDSTLHYSCDLSVVLNEKWDAEHCMVVAFLTDANKLNVIQAEEVPAVVGTDGGQSIRHGGVTPNPVSATYPESGQGPAVYIKADTINLQNAGIEYYTYPELGIKHWLISGYTLNQYYASGSNKYIPYIEVGFFTENTATSYLGSYTFENAIDTYAPGTGWAGYRDDEHQKLTGSMLYLISYSYFMQGYFYPGAQWLITAGSTLEITADGFLVSGTSLTGKPIIISFKGTLRNYGQQNAPQRAPSRNGSRLLKRM